MNPSIIPIWTAPMQPIRHGGATQRGKRMTEITDFEAAAALQAYYDEIYKIGESKPFHLVRMRAALTASRAYLAAQGYVIVPRSEVLRIVKKERVPFHFDEDESC